MSWAVGFDSRWDRDIGYGVPATCDRPGCGEAIDRGLSFVCGGEPYGGERGCGLYFCGAHLTGSRNLGGRSVPVCGRCDKNRPPYDPAPDTREWITWKLTDESWAPWRDANPEKVAAMQTAISNRSSMNNGNVIYLAARYSRRLELCGYRSELEDRGFCVPARWLNGGHQIGGGDMIRVPLTAEGERKFEEGHPDADHLRAKFAADDLNDVLGASTVIAFTEEPRSGNSRGGRHVKLGIAIGALLAGPAASRRIIVVGPRENLFCWLPFIEHYESWTDVRDMIDAELAGILP